MALPGKLIGSPRYRATAALGRIPTSCAIRFNCSQEPVFQCHRPPNPFLAWVRDGDANDCRNPHYLTRV